MIFIFASMFSSCGRNSAKDVDVPNFIGMKLSDVQNNPDYKFVWKVESVYDSSKEEGVIIDQEPSPNSKKVKEGATIVLKVNSSGVLVTVPVVKGLSEDIAKSKISNVGLKTEVLMVVDEETAQGIVCNVDPQEGSKVTADSTVRLYVSKGPAEEKVIVPDVLNKSLIAAKNDIISAGLKVSDNISSESSDKPKDTVISMEPLPGISVGKDSVVKLTISSGVKREKNFEITVDLPSDVNHEVTLSYYVNGVLEDSKKVVPSYNGTYTIKVKGTTGKKTINVNLDSMPYRVYDVDFDASSGNVKKSKSYTYKEKASTTSSKENENDENEEYR